MIVASGLLVLAAAGLLVDGVFFVGSDGTPWQVVAAIVLGVATFAAVLAGAVRHRDRVPAPEPPAGALPPMPAVAAPVAPPAPPAAPVPPAWEPPATRPAPAAERPAEPDEPVLVVPGEAFHHRDGCPELLERGALPLTLAEATTAGYRPCPVCSGGQALTDERLGAVDPTVVVVRGRYHRPDCRYVAVAEECSEQPRSLARAAGVLPCGVCLP